MKAFLLAVLSAAGLALAAGALLESFHTRADQAYATSSVRLPDHGTTHNLIGRDWSSAREH